MNCQRDFVGATEEHSFTFWGVKRQILIIKPVKKFIEVILHVTIPFSKLSNGCVIGNCNFAIILEGLR